MAVRPDPSATPLVPAPLVPVPLVPAPRAPLDGRTGAARWYGGTLGWPVVPGPTGAGLRLVTGELFDVLELPAEAGHAVLRRLRPSSPVALGPASMRLLVAAGAAQELPGLLEWLEWGALATELRAYGSGASIEAPAVPRAAGPGPGPDGTASGGPGSGGVTAGWVWLNPPPSGPGAESGLPAWEMPAWEMEGVSAGRGGGGGAPGLARLVDAAATECHRLRLWGTATRPTQRCASSYA